MTDKVEERTHEASGVLHVLAALLALALAAALMLAFAAPSQAQVGERIGTYTFDPATADRGDNPARMDFDGRVPVFAYCAEFVPSPGLAGLKRVGAEGRYTARWIVVNTCSAQWVNATLAERQLVIAHEAAHARGYTHSECSNGYGYGGNRAALPYRFGLACR